jgi:PAS domain S-box-containing protein
MSYAAHVSGSPQRTAPHDALLSAIIDSTQDAVLSTDLDGRITSWNHAAVELYGYEHAEAIDASFAMLFPDPAEADDVLRRVATGQRIEHQEAERRAADGTIRMVGETTSPVLDHDGSVIGAATISRDISERLAAEQALAEAATALEAEQEQLQQLNEELQRFVYVASHDLSEPLRTVAGMVGLLRRRYRGQLDADADEFIDFAVAGCARMRDMIDGLLAYTRAGQDAMSTAPVALDEVLAAVVDSLASLIATSEATVRVDELPLVRGDRVQLMQLFQNLLSNAVKFRRDDMRPTVAITATGAALADGTPAWRIDVVDDGIGIDGAYRDRIFAMFQRLHPHDRYEGTGIGLALAMRITQRHGGALSMEDNELGGSTFSVTLPAGEDADGA